MSDSESNQAIKMQPIACTLSGPDFAARRETIAHDLFGQVERVVELDDGFACRFASADPWPAKVLDFIAAERRCCPFFTFEMVFEPDDGPLWLRLRGSAEIKSFLRDAFPAGLNGAESQR